MKASDRPTEEVGVIIGRFQTPRLHKAHRELIEAVFERHKKVLVLLGVSPIKLSKRDPLDFMSREAMIKKAYPRAVVIAVEDMANDLSWSVEVDNAVRRAVGAASAMLYGSRDSFIPHYQGMHKTTELPASRDVSATEIREEASKEVRSEEAWRIGIVYATSQRFLISYQCVDAVIWRRKRPAGWSDHGAGAGQGPEGSIEILLGRKKTDPPGRVRFPGGFVDVEDPDLEGAAKREAAEETGVTTFFSSRYLFSARSTDWRYRKERDKIMTAVFALEFLTGTPKAGDDLDEVQWFDLDEFDSVHAMLVDGHRPLWAKVKEHLELLRLEA